MAGNESRPFRRRSVWLYLRKYIPDCIYRGKNVERVVDAPQCEPVVIDSGPQKMGLIDGWGCLVRVLSPARCFHRGGEGKGKGEER